MLSVINLFDMKALWVLEINLGSKGFKRFAKTLAINLYRALHRLMGWLRLVGILLVFRTDKTASMTSRPIFPQNYL